MSMRAKSGSSRVPPNSATAQTASVTLRVAIILLLIGALLSIASAALTLAAHLQDPHVAGGIGSGTYAAPGIILALLFAVSIWAGGQGNRGFCVVMSIATLICAIVIFILVALLLGYDCMDYNANPLTVTGCSGSVPSPTGQLITAATLTMALTPLIALAAIVSALAGTVRKHR